MELGCRLLAVYQDEGDKCPFLEVMLSRQDAARVAVLLLGSLGCWDEKEERRA